MNSISSKFISSCLDVTNYKPVESLKDEFNKITELARKIEEINVELAQAMQRKYKASPTCFSGSVNQEPYVWPSSFWQPSQAKIGPTVKSARQEEQYSSFQEYLRSESASPSMITPAIKGPDSRYSTQHENSPVRTVSPRDLGDQGYSWTEHLPVSKTPIQDLISVSRHLTQDAIEQVTKELSQEIYKRVQRHKEDLSEYLYKRMQHITGSLFSKKSINPSSFKHTAKAGISETYTSQKLSIVSETSVVIDLTLDEMERSKRSKKKIGLQSLIASESMLSTPACQETEPKWTVMDADDSFFASCEALPPLFAYEEHSFSSLHQRSDDSPLLTVLSLGDQNLVSFQPKAAINAKKRKTQPAKANML